MRPINVKSRKSDEKDLQTRILTVFGAMPELRLFRANVGVAKPVGRDNMVKFGVKGQADINGIVRGTGRRVEIEVKTAKGRLSDDQVAWGQMIERMGGIYVVARSIDDVYVAMAAAGVVLSMVPAGLPRAELAGDRGSCPCLHTVPCDPRCTCVTPDSSTGCDRCCSYGSRDQRRARAEALAGLIGGGR